MGEKKSLFSRLREGLFKSREHMAVAMEAAVANDRPIDDEFYDDLTDALIMSDMGAACAMEAIEKYGALKGGWLALKRICRCNPFNKGDWYDPVP